MALTKGTQIVKAALQRSSKLEKVNNVSLPTNYKIMTEDNAMQVLKAYSSAGSLKKTDIDNVFRILEEVEEKGSGKYLATYIANEIIPSACIYESSSLNRLSVNSRLIIESSLEKNKMYDRMIKNQAVLEKRFNISNICKKYKKADKVCHELCELIDTYDIPLTHKFNVALENVLFSLVKNNIVFESDMDIANNVVKYFVNRDAIIYDSTYKKYQSLLKESDIYDITEASGLTKALLENSGNYFAERVANVFSDSYRPEIKKLASMFDNIVTEADAIEYINKASECIDHNQVTTLDTNRVYYSVNMISKHAGIDPAFIKMNAGDIFDSVEFSGKFDVDFPDRSPDIFDSIPSIKNIIAEMEVCQCKDAYELCKIYNLILVKPTATLFGNIMDICTVIRNSLYLIAANETIDELCEETLSFFKKVYALSTNFAQITNLNNALKVNFLCNLPSHLSNNVFLLNFQSEMEKLVEIHGDTSLMEETNIFACFENNTEEMYEAFNTLCEAAEDIMNKKIKPHILESIIEDCSIYGCTNALYEIYKYSNSSSKVFESAYNNVYDNKTMRPLEDIIGNNKKEVKSESVESLFYMIEATNILSDITEQIMSGVVTEDTKNKSNNDKKKKGVDTITTIRLGLQSLKGKLSKMNAKQKEMWRTLDAYANKFTSTLEDDDNERRTAILQGKTMPAFSKCIQTGVALIAAGVATGNVLIPIIGAVGVLGCNKALNDKQRKQLMDEILIEMKVIEKEIDLAEKEDDTARYRQLLRVQRKMQHEYERLKFKRKSFKIAPVSGGR